MPQRCAGSQFVITNGVNHGQPLGDQVDDSTIDLIQPMAEFEEFIRSLPEQLMVVVDEAYSEYIDLPDYPNCVSWIARYPNLIVTRTFSKAHGLAALRVGYSVSSPEIAELLNRVRQPFNVNSLALRGAEAALEDHEFIRASVASNQEGIDRLGQVFRADAW